MSWTPPTPLGDTTGYRISYTGGGSSDSVDIDGGSTDEYTLTDLQNGETYNISIVATSQHLPSDTVALEHTLSEAKTLFYALPPSFFLHFLYSHLQVSLVLQSSLV